MSSIAPGPLWGGRALALLGILLVALNLRTAVGSLSPIVASVESEVALSAVMLGTLGMLPPLCYAVFGIVTPALARRLGLERVMVIALVALVLGLLGRGLAPGAWWLLAASAAAFAGLGVANVLLPPLVKKYFPDRIGLLTMLYTALMAVSAMLPPLVAVPLADATDWRFSLALWGVFALLALVPWLAMLAHPRVDTRAVLPEEAEPAMLGRVWRSPLAWSLVIVFAAAGFNAYAMFAWLPTMLADLAGVGPAEAGALLSLFAAMGLPAALILPLVAARGHVRPAVAVGVMSFVLGYGGLLIAPAAAPWLWVLLIGNGPLLFPLSLVLINLRTRTHTGAVALSSFVQSIGYLIVAAGPLLVGVLHDASDGWTVPIWLLLASAGAAAVAGFVVGRPRMLEDERSGRTNRASTRR